jgi:hypothetical protein
MDFPGFDMFEPTAPLMHAIFALLEEIPADCSKLEVEFEEQGMILVTAHLPNNTKSDVQVRLSDEALAAAGLLLEYISYQLAMLTRMHEQDGDDAVFAAQGRLRDSLAEFRLSTSLLDKDLAHTIAVAC